jgi:hydroxyacylglutathione hydrolase
MLKVKRFINELMTSNCYVVYEEGFDDCIVVDPASRYCLNEISFFEKHKVKPSYIILTHEHTDHTWGCNTLIDKYDTKVVCCKACAGRLGKEGRSYFLFYYNDVNYYYHVSRVDLLVDNIGFSMKFHDFDIKFFLTPGHSLGSMCFSIDGSLFTGDTIMQCKPVIDKKKGSYAVWENSVKTMCSYFPFSTTIFPGHGNSFTLFGILMFMDKTGITKNQMDIKGF